MSKEQGVVVSIRPMATPERRREQVKGAQRTYAESKKAQGEKRVSFWANVETQRFIAEYAKETGATRDEAINDFAQLAQREIQRLVRERTQATEKKPEN